MTLPNEIDQDVACPDCGEAFAILDDGACRCENGNCVSAHEWRSRKHVAALRNQRKPWHTEIPTSELEELREARESYCVSTRLSTSNPDRDEDRVAEAFGRFDDAIDAILAHIPAKVKTDHVAELRRMLSIRDVAESRGINAMLDLTSTRIAALEAAIEAMEKKP